MLSKATITASLLLTCATSERDRERKKHYSERYGSYSGKVAALPNGNDTALENVIPNPFHDEVAGLLVCCTLHWSNCSRNFGGGGARFGPQEISTHNPGGNGGLFPETLATNYQTTRRNNPKDPLSQQQRSENNKSLFLIIKNIFLSVYFISIIHCVLLIL
jgi:hypothetical protein